MIIVSTEANPWYRLEFKYTEGQGYYFGLAAKWKTTTEATRLWCHSTFKERHKESSSVYWKVRDYL